MASSEPPAEGLLTVYVKPTAAQGSVRYTVQVAPSATVLEVKELLSSADRSGIPGGEQRLIYKGSILKDERTVESYGASGSCCRCTAVLGKSGRAWHSTERAARRSRGAAAPSPQPDRPYPDAHRHWPQARVAPCARAVPIAAQ